MKKHWGVTIALVAIGLASLMVAPTPAAAVAVDGIRGVGWGANGDGWVGDGTTTVRTAPVDIVGFGNGVKQLSSGWQHSLGLLSDGTVWGWGSNDTGDVGDGTTTSRHAPVPVSGLGNVVEVSAGGGFSLALKADGTVWAWGGNTVGQLGLGFASDNPQLTPVQVPGLSAVKHISAGFSFAMALLTDNTVRTWGGNGFGQLGTGSTSAFSATPVPVLGLISVTQISAGSDFAMALLTDHTLRSWGDNFTGELGNGTTVNRSLPGTVPGLSNVLSVSAGWVQTVAALADGTARSWGSNRNGELGDGTTATRLSPVPVAGLSGVAQVSAGVFYSMALLSDGTARAWGDNSDGELGDASFSSSLTPVSVFGLTGATQISAGGFHSFAIRSVPDFALALDPASGSAVQGNAVTTQLTLTAVNGFTGSATVTASGLPAGVQFSGGPVSPGTPATLTFSTAATSPAGTYPVTLTATSGDLVRTVNYELTITTANTPPDFSIALNPTGASLSRGTDGTSTVTLTALNGFTGTATLTATGAPAGVTVTFTPAAVGTGTPVTMRISVGSGTAVGVYSITVKATGGELVRTATYRLTVNRLLPP
jgi:alpha-tubulin suppressor-like RCC1 family protein